jgi:addiction module RelB/DinJ family antitoxin
MANTTIQIRTDADIKSAADSIFNRLGITMSDGINIFLRQVQLHQGFPFDVKLKDGEKQEAKKWNGLLPDMDHPKRVKDFKIYTRDEIHDRHSID